MPEKTVRRIFRFGVFEADEAEEDLRKRGVRVKLHSQPFRLLMMLLERPSEVVTREDMRQRLWGQDTFVDFDHGLNTAVNKIREVLNDSASAPRYVETVSGKGYRFIAPVTLQAPVPEPARKAAEDAESAPPRSGIASAATALEANAGATEALRPRDHTGSLSSTILTAPDELPAAPRMLVRIFLLLIQAMYVGFYIGALANLQEIHDIFLEAKLSQPAVLMALLVTTGAVLIPTRLYIFLAVAFDFRDLPSKFAKLFPILLVLDLLWALSPFLLTHHVSTGLAVAMSAPLVYVPFAQRSLVLMYGHGKTRMP